MFHSIAHAMGFFGGGLEGGGACCGMQIPKSKLVTEGW